jgi:hypothetical protein
MSPQHNRLHLLVEVRHLMPKMEQIEQERQRAEQECQQKERLMAYVRSQGIDPDNLPASDD